MIYIKTALGRSALKNRSFGLSPRQRSAFIIFDGKRSVPDILETTSGLGVTADDVDHLVALGLLVAAVEAVAPPAPPAESAKSGNAAPSLNDQAHYSKAYSIATRLTAGLGLRGFRLNLAVKAAGDLVELRKLAPRIKKAVGPEKFSELQSALYA